MPKRLFALEPDGPEGLEISWEGGWFLVAANVRVKLDGEEIAVFPSPDVLRNEQVVRLPDGTNFALCWTGSSNFVVRRDGTDVSTLFHPKRKIREIASALTFIGSLNVVLFIWSLVLKEPIYSPAFLIIGLCVSSIAVILGLLLPFKMRQLFYPSIGSFVSLLIVFLFADVLATNSQVNIGGIIVLVYFYLVLVMAGIKEFRTRPRLMDVLLSITIMVLSTGFFIIFFIQQFREYGKTNSVGIFPVFVIGLLVLRDGLKAFRSLPTLQTL